MSNKLALYLLAIALMDRIITYNQYRNREMQEPSLEDKPKETVANIATMVRLRPLLPAEHDQKQSIFCVDEKTLELKMSGGKREERAEKVFSSTCTQREIFENVKPLISRCSEGFNVTVFTYGQTGSGKTYTMFGSDWNNILRKNSNEKSKQSTFLRSLEQDENHAGIIPRTIHHVFNNLIVKRRKHIKVFCSFLQLYNENMMDLFEDDKSNMNKKMLIHENKADGIYVEGLNEVEALDVDHCLQLMQRGEKNRIVRQTHMNVKSSRSHTIFQLLIEEVFPATKSYRRMKVNLCDLAGSEKINKAEKMEQQHFDELKNINLSLTTLGKVIANLSEKAKAPFRESKLTRLLQDSLGGNTFTALISTITSKSSCLQESLNTLKFLERAKQIKTSVVTKVYNENPEMRNLQKQIAYLKDILKMKRTGVEIDLDMTEKLKKLQSENQKLKEMIDRDLVEKLTRENNQLKRQLDRKVNDGILEAQANYATLQPTGHTDNLSSNKDRSVTEKPSDVVSSYSTNKMLVKQKYLITKTYTDKPEDNRSTNKESEKMFPSIKSIGGKKRGPSTILERIHEIQRTKQANKIKLEQDLSKIGQSMSYDKKSQFGRSSKYSSINSRYGAI